MAGRRLRRNSGKEVLAPILASVMIGESIIKGLHLNRRTISQRYQ